MTDKPTQSLTDALIHNLRELKSTRESLVASGLPVPSPQSVMIPIPNVLITDKDPNVCKFINKLGLLNREKSLGLEIKIEQGATVELIDKRKSSMLELVFYYTEDTDIDGVEAFLNKED